MPALGLSYAAAGTLAMCFQMANSVSQLGFGALADRWRPKVLVMAGPLLAVIMLSLVGLATSPLMLGVILVLGGLGGAAFHPPAAALVYRMADHRKGLAMSAHLSGGSLGFSFAPVLFAPFIAAMGLPWSPLIMIPGLLALSFTLRHVPEMPLPPAHERSTLDTLRPAAVPLTLLYFTIVLRTVTSYGFMTFAPPLLTEQGFTIGEASTAVSLYLFASGIGGFVGGPLADRFGARRVILWSLVAAVPFMAVAPRLSPIGFTAHAGRRRAVAAIDAADQRHVRANVRERRRGHRLVADDGLRVGHGQPVRAAHRRQRRPLRHRANTRRAGVCPAAGGRAWPGGCPTVACITSSRRSIPFRDRRRRITI